jgi:hypothetical protein
VLVTATRRTCTSSSMRRLLSGGRGGREGGKGGWLKRGIPSLPRARTRASSSRTHGSGSEIAGVNCHTLGLAAPAAPCPAPRPRKAANPWIQGIGERSEMAVEGMEARPR